MRRWWPWITGVIAASALVWVFLYLKDLHPLGSLEGRWGAKHASSIALKFTNAQMVGRSGGRKAWAFKAKAIEVSRDRQFATFRSVHEGSIFDNGKQMASLATDKVIYNTLTRNVSVPGAVRISLANGLVFKVKRLYWNGRKSKLVCQKGISAAMGGSILSGQEMTIDLPKQEILISKLKGRVQID